METMTNANALIPAQKVGESLNLPAAGLMTCAMKNEIMDSSSIGINVHVVETYDPVSDADAEKIEVINNFLLDVQTDYDNFSDDLKQKGLEKPQYKQEMSMYRERVMFGDPINAMPWHNQRGTAMALQTIQEAGPELKRMGGSIGLEVLDQTIDGVPLRDKLAQVTSAVFKGQVSEDDAYTLADMRLSSIAEFVEAPVTEAFSDIIGFCADSCGIRARGQIVEEKISSHMNALRDEDKLPQNPRMISLGCGNGKTILTVAKALVEDGFTPTVELIDQDPVALAFALQLAENLGLKHIVNTYCVPIFNDNKALAIRDVLAVTSDEDAPIIIEDSGLREYLKDDLNLELNKACLEALHSEGMSISGNMNTNRFNPGYLHGAMGWAPRVQMRTIEEMVTIYSEAGVSRNDIEALVTKDGLYTMYAVKKQDLLDQR